MAYYFKSDNDDLLAEGSGESRPGVRPWDELRAELIATPSAMHAVYSFLRPEEKLPHCAVCKAFQRDIGAAPLVVDPRQAPRFLVAVLSNPTSTQYEEFEAVHFRGAAGDEVRPAVLRDFGQCLRDKRFGGLRQINCSYIDALPKEEDHEGKGSIGPLLGALHLGICHRMTHLSLEHCALGQRGTEHLAALFWSRQTPLISSLCLGDNGAGIFGMKKLCQSLRMLERLSELDISFNDGQDMGARALNTALRFLDSVRVLNFGGNRCGAEGGRLLGEMMEGEYLDVCEELRLGANADDPAFTDAVCRSLAAGKCTKLGVLDLSGNGMNKHGMRTLAAGLGAGCTKSLHTLDVSRNALGPVGAQLLAGCFVGLPALRALYMQSNYAEEGMRDFLSALKHGACPGLEVLNISDNQLGDLGFKLLGDLLTSGACLCVRELYAATNQSGDEGMVEFAPALYAAGYPLKVLDLSFNNIGSNGILRLADGLGDEITHKPNCPNLNWLNLAGLADSEYLWAIHEKVNNFVCPSLTALNVSLDTTLTGGIRYLKSMMSKPPREDRRAELMALREKRREQERAEKAERVAKQRQEARERKERKEQELRAAAILRADALAKIKAARAEGGGAGPSDGSEPEWKAIARARRWQRDEQRHDHRVAQGKLLVRHVAERKGLTVDPVMIAEAGPREATAMAERSLGTMQTRESALFTTRQKQQRFDLHDVQLTAVRSEKEVKQNHMLDQMREEQRLRVKQQMKELGFR